MPSLVWGRGQENRLRMIVAGAGLDPDRKKPALLVNGCGVGQYAGHLQPYFDHVVGIDVERVHLDQAGQRFPAVDYSLTACERLPLATDRFDLVLSHEVLEHVEDDRLSMEEMVRVVKPSGHIILFVPNRWFPFETHGMHWGDQYYFGNIPLLNYLPSPLRDRLAPHVRTYDDRAIRRLCHGLPVRICHWSHVWPAFDALRAASPFWGAGLKRVVEWLHRTPVRRGGLSHFIVLQTQT